MIKKKKNLFEINLRFLYLIFLKNVYFEYFFTNHIYFLKFNNYKNILYFYKFKKNLQKIIYPFKFKYSWIKSINDFNKYYLLDFSKNYYNFTEINQLNKYHILQNFIIFKNKINLYKNNTRIKHVYLNKINYFKENLIDKNYFDLDFSENSFFLKIFEFLEKKIPAYNSNRLFIKFFFNLNKKRKFFLNKFLKKLIKLNNLNFLNFFEYSLKNIIQNSNIFLNNKDLSFFLKNGFVCINGKSCYNYYQNVSVGDCVNIIYNKYYFFFFKNYINDIYQSSYKYNKIFKKVNKLKSTELKKDLKYINKIIFFKNDVPNYLELDYITMSLFLIYKNINCLNYNYFNLKLLNVFLKRLYNWKYII